MPYHLSDDRTISVKKKEGQFTVIINQKSADRHQNRSSAPLGWPNSTQTGDEANDTEVGGIITPPSHRTYYYSGHNDTSDSHTEICFLPPQQIEWSAPLKQPAAATNSQSRLATKM